MLDLAVAAIFAVRIAAPGESAEGRSEDLTAIIEKARQVQVADVAAWREFRFRRSSVREELDESGGVKVRESLVFEVAPRGGGFDEKLVEIDGRKPTKDESEAHRDQARFAKHYRTLTAGSGEQEEGGFSLGHLFRMSSYRYAGRDTVNDIPCYRIDFAPDPKREFGGVEGKIARAMQGSIWITVDELHLARAKARTVAPVSIALSLAMVHELELAMEAARIAENVWLPTEVDVKTHLRILFSTRHRRNTYHYTGFESVRSRVQAPGETPPPER